MLHRSASAVGSASQTLAGSSGGMVQRWAGRVGGCRRGSRAGRYSGQRLLQRATSVGWTPLWIRGVIPESCYRHEGPGGFPECQFLEFTIRNSAGGDDDRLPGWRHCQQQGAGIFGYHRTQHNADRQHEPPRQTLKWRISDLRRRETTAANKGWIGTASDRLAAAGMSLNNQISWAGIIGQTDAVRLVQGFVQLGGAHIVWLQAKRALPGE